MEVRVLQQKHRAARGPKRSGHTGLGGWDDEHADSVDSTPRPLSKGVGRILHTVDHSLHKPILRTPIDPHLLHHFASERTILRANTSLHQCQAQKLRSLL
eukprot:40217-Eustigmatos_ZCMA.PRE.1